MRQAGTFSDPTLAQRFADYLLTQGISTKVDADGSGWAVWVHDEDQLPIAVSELQSFLAEPDAARYKTAAQNAELIRQQHARLDQDRSQNLIELRDRWEARPSGRRPLTIVLMGACILVFIAADFGENLDSKVLNALWFSPPPKTLVEKFSWTPMKAIDEGQVWRLVTPIFIHFGPMHLIFNLYMLYQFGSLIEIRRGALRLGLIVLAVAAISNFAQYFFPYQLHWGGDYTPNGGGMSGVVYGLFGYVWMKSRFDPRSLLFVDRGTVVLLTAWLVLGFTGVLDQLVGGRIGNWAHAAGLAAGAAIGYAPIAWRKLNR